MCNFSLFALAICTVGITSVLGQSKTVSSLVTFYGSRDNCPPGADISYPTIHKEAGGTGTFADPVTFAAAKSCFTVGGKVYVPRLKKYFIFEDDCAECDTDCKKGKLHIDCWMGPQIPPTGPNLIACENQLTGDSTEQVIVNPASNLAVDVTPLFNGTTDTCIVHADPCQDEGNTCGNSCSIPNTATCQELAKLFYLNYTRFLQLNPNLDCSKSVKAGTDVCQGGTCGDR